MASQEPASLPILLLLLFPPTGSTELANLPASFLRSAHVQYKGRLKATMINPGVSDSACEKNQSIFMFPPTGRCSMEAYVASTTLVAGRIPAKVHLSCKNHTISHAARPFRPSRVSRSSHSIGTFAPS